MALINFSNHPSAAWSTEQLAAAARYGEIIDITFPLVDPNADEAEINRLADQCVAQIVHGRNIRDTTVHIMGEFTLCYAVINRLHMLGVRCLASCTHRDVTYPTPETKQVHFHFTRFREYTK